MGFLDKLDDQRGKGKSDQEALAAIRGKALKALDDLLMEIRGCFGEDPKAHGVQIENVSFSVMDNGVSYDAPALKVTFDSRKSLRVQPGGLAFGGFRVDIQFYGCPDNQPHVLLYAGQEGTEERVWAFSRKDGFGRPQLVRWTKEGFEEILDRQVIGSVRIK